MCWRQWKICVIFMLSRVLYFLNYLSIENSHQKCLLGLKQKPCVEHVDCAMYGACFRI